MKINGNGKKKNFPNRLTLDAQALKEWGEVRNQPTLPALFLSWLFQIAPHSSNSSLWS